MIHFKLGEVSIDVFPAAKHIRTTFPDGAFLPASPQDNDDYRATALKLSYTDTWAMCWQHELTHTVYAQSKGQPYSQALYKAAIKEAFNEADYLEEAAVLEIQRGYHDGSLQNVEPELYRTLTTVFQNVMKEIKLTIQIEIDPDLSVFVDAIKSKGVDIITGQPIPKGSPAVWIKSRYGRRIQTWLVTNETYQNLIAANQS